MICVILLAALQVTPELTQHINAGLKAKSAGDLDTAVREFRRVVELAPRMSAAHVNLGAVYLDRRDYANAIPPLKTALELNPDLPGAHGMLGTALLAQGFAADAVPHLEKADAVHLIGVALLESGRARDAVDRLEAALGQRPDDPDLLYYLGRAHAELAEHVFQTLRSKHPESPRTRLILGEALASAGKRGEAEKHLRAALESRPDLRGVHYALGDLALSAGDYDRAEAEFRAEAQRTPGSAAAAFNLGLALANLGRTSDAIAEFKRSNALKGDMPETLLELGKALNAVSDWKAAEMYLVRVLGLEKETVIAEVAHFQLARTYRALGRAADAEKHTALFERLRKQREGR